MNDDTAGKPSGLSSGQIFKLVLGIVVFGVLMGVRMELQQVWMRALVAGCAGAALGWAVIQARSSKA